MLSMDIGEKHVPAPIGRGAPALPNSWISHPRPSPPPDLPPASDPQFGPKRRRPIADPPLAPAHGPDSTSNVVSNAQSESKTSGTAPIRRIVKRACRQRKKAAEKGKIRVPYIGLKSSSNQRNSLTKAGGICREIISRTDLLWRITTLEIFIQPGGKPDKRSCLSRCKNMLVAAALQGTFLLFF